MTSWYYVEGKDRVGPIDEGEFISLYGKGVLTEDSYVWRKGFDNWQRLGQVEELNNLFSKNEKVAEPEALEASSFDWNEFSHDERIFTIKVGIDRGGAETEYGPFSLRELQKAYQQKRINHKTFIFTPGLENWAFLGETPIFNEFFEVGENNLEIPSELREHVRKPFLARMLFHNQEQVYEGVCRDISVGGLQVLVPDYPGKVGEDVTMNVHPDNGDYCFSASGKIVRLLDAGQGFSLVFSSLSSQAKEAIESYLEN